MNFLLKNSLSKFQKKSISVRKFQKNMNYFKLFCYEILISTDDILEILILISKIWKILISVKHIIDKKLAN